MKPSLKIAVVGLSITSSWGNGHATTYRALIRELAGLGHRVTFLERDVPWYSDNRDMPNPRFCQVHLYADLAELERRFAGVLRSADVVIVGSYVPEGIELAERLFRRVCCPVVFYDIDTPVTLAKLERGDYEYLSPEAISRYDLYLSFSGGPILELLQEKYGAQAAKALYCSVDPRHYYPEEQTQRYDLGYLGTYSEDRQGPLNRLLIEPARRRPTRRFIVAGPQYPENLKWPPNIHRLEHLPPAEHRTFYNRQRLTLNITRHSMIRAGYSPSVRLFEAAACGTPIISDYWTGLETFFEPGREILISHAPEDTLRYLDEVSEEQRRTIGRQARRRVLRFHTARTRARQLEHYLYELIGNSQDNDYQTHSMLVRHQNG